MSKHRMDVKQAAEALGISSEGVSQRIRRGTLESEKGADGRVYVWLDGEANGSPATEREFERDTHGVITRLEDEVAWLRREVERKDALLMTLMHRVPELEPLEARGSPETAAGEAEGAADPRPADKGGQEGAGRRPSGWWRRLLFGE